MSNHHEWCGECVHVTYEHTPPEFPLPGEIAEEVCRKILKPHKLHRAIAEAISQRDKMWAELRAAETCIRCDGEEPSSSDQAVD